MCIGRLIILVGCPLNLLVVFFLMKLFKIKYWKFTGSNICNILIICEELYVKIEEVKVKIWLVKYWI